MFADIFPRDVLWLVAADWMWDTELCAAEEALVANAVEKRKREFRAGRHCAHALLKQAGVDCAALLKGKQREPAWPHGWIGSISHTRGLCVVALASTSRYRSIGLDVEQTGPLEGNVLNLICSSEEQREIAELQQLPGRNFASLPLSKVIFSAKESIHKTYFPLNYHTLDFLDARIKLDPVQNSFAADIIKPEPSPRVPITSLQGKFSLDDQYIATFIALNAGNTAKIS